MLFFDSTDIIKQNHQPNTNTNTQSKQQIAYYCLGSYLNTPMQIYIHGEQPWFHTYTKTSPIDIREQETIKSNEERKDQLDSNSSGLAWCMGAYLFFFW